MTAWRSFCIDCEFMLCLLPGGQSLSCARAAPLKRNAATAPTRIFVFIQTLRCRLTDMKVVAVQTSGKARTARTDCARALVRRAASLPCEVRTSAREMRGGGALRLLAPLRAGDD